MKMRLLSRIRPFWFFLAFGVGLCVCYVFTPPPKVVVKFPTPANVGKVIYKGDDKTDHQCYAYSAKRVTCTSDAKEQPLYTQTPTD